MYKWNIQIWKLFQLTDIIGIPILYAYYKWSSLKFLGIECWKEDTNSWRVEYKYMDNTWNLKEIWVSEGYQHRSRF